MRCAVPAPVLFQSLKVVNAQASIIRKCKEGGNGWAVKPAQIA